ncbi:MAG: copper amine oxidase N-terminal domain-containing protein [Oscillospiraceae bacterium]
MLRITLDVCWYALNCCLSGKMRLSPGSLSRRLFPVCSGDHCHPFHHLWVAMDYGFLVLYMTETNKERIFFRETSISLRAIGRGCSSRARQCGQNSARTCRWRQTTWYPYLESGVTYVPLRYLLDALGGWTVDWDSTQKAAVASSGSTRLTATPSKDTIQINQKTLRGNVTVSNGRTYVAVRLVAEALGKRWSGTRIFRVHPRPPPMRTTMPRIYTALPHHPCREPR